LKAFGAARPRKRGRACAVALSIALACSAVSCSHDNVARPLTLTNTPAKFSRTDAAATTRGKLRFRGGVTLTSSDRAFGGLSGILVSADGTRFVAVSDQAHWVTGTLEYESGKLVRAVGATIAPMLDLDGKPLSNKAGDAEGLASTSGNDTEGDLFVSFEGDHRVWRYPFAERGVQAVPVNVPIPPEVRGAPHNGGLEGIALFTDTMLFGVSERFRDEAGDYRAWFLPLRHGAAPGANDAAVGARAVTVRPVAPFAMTDVRRLAGGDVLTLERRYSAVKGVGARLRRIPSGVMEAAATSGVGMPLDGELVADFDPSYEIDNMEGLAVRTGEGGETLVYAISDDNFNRPVQSTLLMMYELLP